MNHADFPFEVKAISDAGVIEGVAAGYGNVDAHGEIFAPGAFTAALQSMKSGGRQPAMLLHHNLNRPAGRWDTFEESAKGLHVRGSLALDASDGREAYALLKGGALTGLSVGFLPRKQKAGPNGANVITEADLFEVSLVAVPSNPLTKISSVKGVGSARDLEDHLRELGMSSRRAKAAASAAFRAAEQDDDPPAAAVSAAASQKFAAAIRDLTRFHRS